MRRRLPIFGLAALLAGPAIGQPAGLRPSVEAARLAPEPDLAFGAYQRGYYLRPSGRRRAGRREGDAAAMTLLGELYARPRRPKDEEGGGVVSRSRPTAARARRSSRSPCSHRRPRHGAGPARGRAWLEAAAGSGQPAATYNLALLYLGGGEADLRRAAERLEVAAEAGNPDAQYALATLYKKAAASQDPARRALLPAARPRRQHRRQVEYAIALFNGTGVAKGRERRGALLPQGRRTRQTVAQNRLARISRPAAACRPNRSRPRPMAHHRPGRRPRRHLARELHATASSRAGARRRPRSAAQPSG